MARKKSDIREHAKELAKLGARKGGQARAAVLTAQERRDIARQAVLARWRKQKGESYQPPEVRAPKPARSGSSATVRPRKEDLPHSLYSGSVRVGPLELNCHVLSDGRRVFIQGAAEAARRGAPRTVELDTFLSRVPAVPGAALHGPNVRFRIADTPSPNPGYEATYLVDVAHAYLKAMDEGRLTPLQVPLARQAQVITRDLARAGITALIDSGTGFEEVRLKRAHQVALQAFIAHDIQEWALRFPEEFWTELARLEGVRHTARSRPLRWGRYVMLFVYDAIEQDTDNRIRARQHGLGFQPDYRRWLEEYNQEQLHAHLKRVVATMRRCKNLAEFQVTLERVFKRVPAEVGFAPAS